MERAHQGNSAGVSRSLGELVWSLLIWSSRKAISMNYASIEDWVCLLSSIADDTCSLWPTMRPSADCTSAHTRVANLATNGLAILNEDGIHERMTAQDMNEVWFISQCLKKFRFGCSMQPAKVALDFESRNTRCTTLHVPPQIAERMRKLLHGVLPNVSDVGVDPVFGPGAVYEGWDQFQRWSNLNTFSYDSRTMGFVAHDPTREMQAPLVCKLTAVPKDLAKLRLITVEPCENTFGQQWVRTILLRSIHTGPLRESVQDLLGRCDPASVQRQRCIDASASAKLATIDLKDASDSIPWSAVCEVFPSWVVALLERFRTPKFLNPHTKQIHDLHMYAGMGNATTFVVESLYFWAYVEATHQWLYGNTSGRVSVWGDDIICPNKLANHPMFEEALYNGGLVINWAKSGRSTAPGFRESCGVAAVAGKQLATLCRIYGADVDDGRDVTRSKNSDLVGLSDLCGLTNRLACEPSHRLWTMRGDKWYKAKPAHYLWGYPLIRDSLASALLPTLIRNGVPVVNRPLSSEGIWVCVPDYVQRDDIVAPPRRFRCKAADGNDKMPVLWRAEYEVRIRINVKRRHYRRTLSASEALGVIAGQLRTSLDKRTKKSVIEVPTRDTRFPKRWIPEA